MKFSPKRVLIAAALATAFVGLSATAIAQGKGPMADGMHAQHMGQRGEGHSPEKMAQRMEQMQKRHAEHQAKLKAELKITASQEAAWTAFVAGTAHTPPMAKGGAHEDWSKLTTPERMDKMLARMTERNAEMGKHVAAVKTLYAALTPEQQKAFDAQRHGGVERTGMKGGRHHMGGHGKHHGMDGKDGMGKGGMNHGEPMVKPKG